jgi:hypothetical protein
MNIGSAQLVTSENLKTSLSYAFYPATHATERGNIQYCNQEGIGQLTGELSINRGPLSTSPLKPGGGIVVQTVGTVQYAFSPS